MVYEFDPGHSWRFGSNTSIEPTGFRLPQLITAIRVAIILPALLATWHNLCSREVATPLERDFSMSNASRIVKASPDELPADIVELATALGRLPEEHRERIEPILARVVESTKRRRRILNLVQDALSQLRLDMKYLMFDLEATRRERDDYRRKVEET
jgi:hypothetical protein